MSRGGGQQETGSLGNVLIGIFAMQMDFVTREQLAAAMGVWAPDRSRTIADILRDQGVISEPDCALLASVVPKDANRRGETPPDRTPRRTRTAPRVWTTDGRCRSVKDGRRLLPCATSREVAARRAPRDFQPRSHTLPHPGPCDRPGRATATRGFRW